MLTQAEVIELFDYRDGQLYRKDYNARYSSAQQIDPNRRHPYKTRRINGVRYLEHRLIFLMFHGDMPAQIDHINGDKLDNRIENLRGATTAENCRNKQTRIDNTSGVKNVSWHRPLKKWRVQICVDMKVRHVGYFEDLDMAKFVASEFRDKYHGEFANHD